MTTYIPFTPSVSSVPQFQVTLDGYIYTALCTWNLYGARYYLNIVTLQGTLVCSVALIASPDDYDINLVAQYFTTSTLVFRDSSQQFEVTP
jgi:hypothetical protein